ncbi:Phospholipase A1-Igamma1, chloroplastic [Ancistrocladus abbreviatus]
MALTFITTHVSLRSEHIFPVTLSNHRCSTQWSKVGKLEVQGLNKPKVLLRTDEPIIATELERNGREERRVEEDVFGEEEAPLVKQQERQIADCWREIHGQDDWAGLLDPMDPLLRSELIRYGEMAQACYDAFDFDPHSKHCGDCKYTRDQLFKHLGMEGQGYEVSSYLFATPKVGLPIFFRKPRLPEDWRENTNWIGYVAVSNDEMSKRLGRRDISIAWRGTVTCPEWILDLMDILKSISSDKIPCHDRMVKVEKGFVELYTNKDESFESCKTSAREQVLHEVERLIEKYHGEELCITITGHSLGGALAILSAYDIAETGLNITRDSRALPISVFSFAGPRVGNARFKERLESLGVKVLRVVNEHDMVPKSPGFLINEHVPSELMKLAEGFPWSYSHVGEELALNHKNSPFLKDTTDPICAHNLEALLHLLDGYHGKGRRFLLATGRDIALVNKACNFLKDHHQIPPFWHQDKSKRMVRSKDGRWIQLDWALV